MVDSCNAKTMMRKKKWWYCFKGYGERKKNNAIWQIKNSIENQNPIILMPL